MNKSLETDETVLENNEKLRTALREEITVEKELRIAEVTLKELTSIELDLRELLKQTGRIKGRKV